MPFPLSNFLTQLHRHSYFTNQELGELLDQKEIKVLKDSELLKRGGDERMILCQSCDDPHLLEVKKDGEEIYSFCSESDEARNLIDPETLATWVFNIEGFLNNLALGLGIDPNVEKLELEGFWEVGRLNREDTLHTCFYYQGKRLEEVLEFMQSRPKEMRRFIVFTTIQHPKRNEATYPLLILDLKEMIELKRNQVTFSKKQFEQHLIHAFRNIIFEPNGDLLFEGRVIARITPSKPEYWFVDLLYKNFNEPVSHKKIEKYIFLKTRKEYEDTAAKLAHKQKQKMKKNAIEPDLIDQIIDDTTDLDRENAYIMRNPM